MAGILDFLQTPEAQMGIGLLAAGGPSTTPMNVGQRVQLAMQGLNAQQQNALKMKLLQSQIDENASQSAVRQAQIAKAQALADAPNSLFGWGGSQQAGAPAAGGVPANMGAGTQPGSLKGVPLSAVTRFKMLGGVDLTKQWELENMGTAQQPGWVVKADGSREFLGDPSKGLTVGPDGVTNVMRGAPEAQASLTRATERAKAEEGARFQEGTPTLDAEGRKVVRSRLDMFGGAPAQTTTDPFLRAIVTTESGGNPNAVSPKGAQGLMQVMPGTNAAPGFGVAPAKDGTEGERTRVGQEYWKAMNERYQNPTLAAIAYNWGPGKTDAWLSAGGDFKKLPPETQSYVAQIMTRGAVNARQPSGNVVELSPAEQAQNEANKVRLTKTAEADVGRDSATLKKEKSAGEMIAAVRRARELLNEGPTGSGAGEMVDKSAAFFGKSTKGAEVSAKLDIVSGDLLNNVPRMEGPQSDGDRIEYKIQAGRAADRTIPPQQRLAAMDELERLQAKYAGLNGGTAPANTQPAGKTFKDFGYASEADAIKDAQRAMLRNPGARNEILRRLAEAGVKMPSGGQGSW